jgi:hypothetical protein
MHMKRLHVALLVLVLVAVPVVRADDPVPPPDSWMLLQNDPDPFCPGVTSIRFAAPVAAEVHLVVLSTDGTTVLRELVHGALAAGLYTIAWDGLDAHGAQLPDGAYPYRLTALDASGGTLFEDSKVATIACNVSAAAPTWSAIKRLYE